MRLDLDIGRCNWSFWDGHELRLPSASRGCDVVWDTCRGARLGRTRRGGYACERQLRCTSPSRVRARRMLQNCPSTERIYTVDGFTGETGEFCTSLACVKMLQCPRGSGPGIIFERAE